MSASLERLARNQALFREVNERIETIAGDNEAVEFVCECSNPDCISTIELTVGEYERVRSNATWFVIKPDHDIPQIERVVSRDDGYAVVEKLIAEEYMEATDPRSDDTQRPPEGRRMRSVRKLSGRSIVCASSGIATTILQQRPRERARR